MTIRINKRCIFYILLIVLIILLAARYSFQIEIPRIVLTSVIVMMALTGNQNEILAISMGCIPLHNAVDFYIAIMACAIILVLKKPKHLKIGLPIILLSLMLIWELLHCIMSQWTPILLLVSLAPLVFLAVIISTNLENIDYAFITRTMALIACVMCMLQLLNYIVRANGDLANVFVNLRRLGAVSEEETLVGGMINPNSLGIVNICGIIGLIQLRSIGIKTKFDNCLIFFLLVFGVLTSSRTFLVCLLLMVILVIVAQKGGLIKKTQALFGIILMACLMLFVLNWIFPETLEYYSGRFLSTDITSGRNDIMKDYHEYITNNADILFFGVGLSDFGDKVVNIDRVSVNVPHNSIQECVAAWGVPGLLMITWLLFMMINRSNRYSGDKILLNYIPLLIILAKSMAGQLLTSGYTILALAFAYLSLCQDFKRSKI